MRPRFKPDLRAVLIADDFLVTDFDFADLLMRVVADLEVLVLDFVVGFLVAMGKVYHFICHFTFCICQLFFICQTSGQWYLVNN